MKSRTPARLDLRSQALKRQIAAVLRANPDLLQIGVDNLERWRYPDGTWGRHTPYMEEWMRAIQRGVEECCRLLEDTTEATQALRTAAPFAGVLSEVERRKFLADWEATS